MAFNSHSRLPTLAQVCRVGFSVAYLCHIIFYTTNESKILIQTILQGTSTLITKPLPHTCASGGKANEEIGRLAEAKEDYKKAQEFIQVPF